MKYPLASFSPWHVPCLAKLSKSLTRRSAEQEPVRSLPSPPGLAANRRNNTGVCGSATAGQGVRALRQRAGQLCGDGVAVCRHGEGALPGGSTAASKAGLGRLVSGLLFQITNWPWKGNISCSILQLL